jgi:hypothetical protein
MYVVHVFQSRIKEKFPEHRNAMKAFNVARKRWRGVGMWYQGTDGKWTRLYVTDGYPEHLSRPWVD